MTSVWDKLKPKETGFSDNDVIRLSDKGGPKYGTISIEQNEPDPDKTAQVEMEEMDIALKACGFGRFQILLLTASAVGLCAEVIVTASTAYVLTAAECDLEMSLVQKGFLSAATYSGMLLSTVPAGFLTDTFGRRVFLMIGFGGIFAFQVLGGLSQTFEVLIFAKVCGGVLFAISFNPLVAMTAEYCYNDIRDRLLMLQSSFVPVSQILTALLAWGMLMNEWEYSLFGGYIQLHAWNFYLLICSLFSLLAWILYSFIPESPKFLISMNKYDEARNVLIKIYTENTGMSPETYPYYNIWRDKSKVQKKVAKSTWWEQIVTGYNNTKPIFKKPLGPVLILICVMQFVCMMTHNVIRFWYPQLATIIEHYSGVEAENGSKDLCIMLDTYTSELQSKITNVTEYSGVCVPTKAGTETYVNTIILGFVCFIPYLVSGALIQNVAKKYLIMVGGLMVFACTLALRWTSSKPVLVSLFSTDVAVSQLLTSLFHNVIVEYYPAVVRSFAMAVVVTLGRLGSLLGNVFFPILLNIGCVVPFFTLAALMLGFTLLSAFLPNI